MKAEGFNRSAGLASTPRQVFRVFAVRSWTAKDLRSMNYAVTLVLETRNLRTPPRRYTIAIFVEAPRIRQDQGNDDLDNCSVRPKKLQG